MAYNILYRGCLLGQGNSFLNQNSGEENLIQDELQSMVATGDFNSVMKKLMGYAKNITGSNAYWNDEKEKLSCNNFLDTFNGRIPLT